MTSKLWQDTDPNAVMWIDATKITEAELRERGVKYRAHKTAAGDGFLIEKSEHDKLRDYHLRLLGTPVTLAVDAASTVLVVGVYMFLHDPAGTVSIIEHVCD